MQNSGNVPAAKIEVKNFGELENFQRKYFRFLLHSNKIWKWFQKGLWGYLLVSSWYWKLIWNNFVGKRSGHGQDSPPPNGTDPNHSIRDESKILLSVYNTFLPPLKVKAEWVSWIVPIQWIFISFSIGSMRDDKNWTQVKTRRGGCFVSGRVTTHLLAECRCCRRESSSDTWSRGDQDPPQRTRSPGNSSAGPEMEMVLLSRWLYYHTNGLVQHHPRT